MDELAIQTDAAAVQQSDNWRLKQKKRLLFWTKLGQALS